MRHDLTLAQVFSFDAVDLAANRAGGLSPDQATMFANSARIARRTPRRIAVLVLLAAVASLVMLKVQGMATSHLVVPAVAVGVVGSIVVAISLLNLRQAKVMDQPVVRVTEGVPSKRPSNTFGRWWLEVGGVRFSVDHGDIDLFDDRTVYRIYHADLGVGSPGILSLEVVSR